MDESQKKIALTGEHGVDLVRLVQVLVKRAWVIILVSLLCGVVTYIASKTLITPTYRSVFTAYVNNRGSSSENQGSTSTSDLTASRSLTYLYQEIILSRSVLTDAASKCGLNYSYEALSEMVNTVVSDGAAIIAVGVYAEDPAVAAQLATAISEVAPDHVARVVEGSSMRIVDPPVQASAPYSPNNMQNAIMGFMLALLLSAVAMILLDMVIDKVHSPKEVEDRYGVVVVGIIPDLVQAEKRNEVYGTEKTGRHHK